MDKDRNMESTRRFHYRMNCFTVGEEVIEKWIDLNTLKTPLAHCPINKFYCFIVEWVDSDEA